MHIQKILYPLSNAPLLNFIKFLSLGGALDKGFYGTITLSPNFIMINSKEVLFLNIKIIMLLYKTN